MDKLFSVNRKINTITAASATITRTFKLTFTKDATGKLKITVGPKQQ